jgi:hypothetical protein
MTEKEAIEKVKGIKGGVEKLKALFAKFNEEPAKFSELTLKDGTKVMIDTDAPAVGSKVDVVTDAGNVPAPDGEYDLEDGSKIVVVGGIITEVKPTEVEPIEAAASNPIEDRLAALEARLVACEEMMGVSDKKLVEASKIIDAQKEELKKQHEIQSETFAIVEKLAALPESKSIETKDKIDNTKSDRILMLSKTLQTLKNK